MRRTGGAGDFGDMQRTARDLAYSQKVITQGKEDDK